MELIGDLERGFAATIYPNRYVIAAVAIVVVVLLAAIARRRGWDLVARRHPRATITALVVAAAIVAPLTWYLGSPLFLSSSVDEPAPVVAAAPSSIATASPAASATALPTPVSPTPVLVSRSGTFRGVDDFHFGRGTARLIETAPGTFTVRLESFEVRNGPDLYVYLSPSGSGYAKGAVELGRLKADRGNQNYAVPAGTNVTAAGSIVIWCKQFSVLFATATLD